MTAITPSEAATAIATELRQISALFEAKLAAVRKEYVDDLSNQLAILKVIPEDIEKRLAAAGEYLTALEQRLAAVERNKTGAAPVESPKREPRSAKKDGSVVAILQASGLEVIDRRKAGGSLWVTGTESQVVPVLKTLEQQGVRFTRAGKSRATGGKPGWYSSTKR